MQNKLGLYGGEPIRNTILPYAKQAIDDADIQAVIQVLKSDFLTTGPVVPQFEEKIATYVGAKYAVAFSSGTAALHAACFAAGITHGDEVITTPMTFAATANSILYVGGKPVFADVDPKTYNISPQAIEKSITPKTKAIITVDYTGQPAAYDEIMELARKYNLIVIDDAAHALGAIYNNKKIGSIADMTMFSFHPVKHITTGEGGIITTNNLTYYKKLRLFRNHGITRDINELHIKDEVAYYEMQQLGYNYRMTDIQAALGLSQYQKLSQFLSKRRKLATNYTISFQHMDCIIPPFQLNNTSSSWHLYVIRFNLDKLQTTRKEIFQAFQKENIGVNIHYIPVYFHPYYQNLGYSKGLCPIAEKLYETIITLPLFPKMTEQDQNDVIQATKKIVSHFSK